jgi:hypothetical protein
MALRIKGDKPVSKRGFPSRFGRKQKPTKRQARGALKRVAKGEPLVHAELCRRSFGDQSTNSRHV